jgi:hypothetical protein
MLPRIGPHLVRAADRPGQFAAARRVPVAVHWVFGGYERRRAGVVGGPRR